MHTNKLRLTSSKVQFGTDGWRGVLGVDFNLERLLVVATAAAQELASRAPLNCKSRTIIVGYDRRFMAAEFAEVVASAVRGCDLEPLITQTCVPTPACSWAVLEREALGALVITASHNPPIWLGLKIKGSFGGSVEGDFTKAVEKRISASGITPPIDGFSKRFDARGEHLNGLRKKFDIPSIVNGLKRMRMKVIVDPMHGSAAGCIGELLGESSIEVLEEIRHERDPLFGGNPPEPLSRYLGEITSLIKTNMSNGITSLGLIFDGDGDRIAAIDESGNFCSTQLLMPLLIDHLAKVRKLPGCVVKTVSGIDLMRLVAEDIGREVIEHPVGFKYIAGEMLSKEVLVGGEESGGIGFGMHLPERDALFAAMLILEAITTRCKPLGDSLELIMSRFGRSHYERIDISLANMQERSKLQTLLNNSSISLILDYHVIEVIRKDGFKYRLGDNHWLMFRFSGTEPLLRIYCEAPTEKIAKATLKWGQDFAQEN